MGNKPKILLVWQLYSLIFLAVLFLQFQFVSCCCLGLVNHAEYSMKCYISCQNVDYFGSFFLPVIFLEWFVILFFFNCQTFFLLSKVKFARAHTDNVQTSRAFLNQLNFLIRVGSSFLSVPGREPWGGEGGHSEGAGCHNFLHFLSIKE